MAERTGIDFNQGAVGENTLPGYGPVIMVKRPVRSRMQGVVGAGGEKPPATRLAVFSLLAAFCSKCACIVFIQWWRCFMPGNLKTSPM